MIILGVDPGLQTTGYGVIRDDDGLSLIEAGYISTKAGEPISKRLRTIYEGLDGLIRERKPEVLAIEKLYSDYRHPSTAILMGHARAVACLLAGLHGLSMANIPSTRVKKALVSHGHASKEQIGRAVAAALSLKKAPYPADVSDALAIAIAHSRTRKWLLVSG